MFSPDCWVCWFIAGLLLATLFWWLFDQLYWRIRQQNSSAELIETNRELRGENTRLKADLSGMQGYRAQVDHDTSTRKGWLSGLLALALGKLGLDAAKQISADGADAQEVGQLRDAIVLLRSERDQLNADLTGCQDSTLRYQGDLTHLRSELDGSKQQLATAQHYLQQRDAEVTALTTELEGLRAQAGSGSAKGVFASLAAFAAGRSTADEGVTLSAEDDDPEVGALRLAIADLRAENERLKAVGVVKPQVKRRDPLVDINGIGPVYQRKLYDADVTTFEQLSQMTPEAITSIIKPEAWQTIDTAAWITEAGLLMRRGLALLGRDPLVDVNGIGPVYQQKLWDAGILRFAQLAALTPERVIEIIKPEAWQTIDAVAWIAEAAELAKKVNNE